MSASLSSRANLDLLDAKYEDWKRDTATVEPTWGAFFEGFELGMAQLAAKSRGAMAAQDTAGLSDETLSFRMRVSEAIMTFRSRGHVAAWLDPLSPLGPDSSVLSIQELGFTEAELDEEVQTLFFRGGRTMKLRDMLAELRRIYCDRVGFEFMYIQDAEVRGWLLERIEALEDPKPSVDPREALRWLFEAETFERFLHRRYVGQKRFSVEGAESLLVALETILADLPRSGGKEIVMGMAHRGRLSVLANFLRKPLEVLFYEFSENYVPNMVAGDGDVKYHLGFETVRQVAGGETVTVHLAANPSHLEAVDPVVEGKARARQRFLDDTEHRKKVIPVLVHGDAALQGRDL